MRVVRLGRRAMATQFEIVACGEDEPTLRSAAEEALDEIARLEEQMSLFLPTSELCAINARAAREEVPVEPGLYALLERASALTRDTDGAFDIAIQPLAAAWGVYTGMASDRRTARRTSGMRHVRLAAGRIRFLRSGVALDLGGIGKGYALDRAAAILRARGVASAFLHGGAGSALAIGAPPGATGWQVGVVDPRRPDERIGRLVLCDRALSTSSPLGKVARVGRRDVGHVIDPRTGEPVSGAAAWALAPTATDSDALATAFLVLGAEAARAYVARRPGTAALHLGRRLRAFGVHVEQVRESRSPLIVSRRDFMKGAAAAAAAFSAGLASSPAEARQEAPARTLGVAVVGTGEQGRLLLSQLARMKDVSVRAVCDIQRPNLEKALAIAGRNVESYDDYRHLLDEETVDAVIVATPTAVHEPVAVAALEKKRHVFCEAPLARTIDQCRRIARAADRAGTVFQVGHQRRCSKLYPHAMTHIRSGAIGRILEIRAQWSRRHSWRRTGGEKPQDRRAEWRLFKESSGGLLLEQGSHIFDLAGWFLGAAPEAVTGMGSLVHWRDGREVDDVVRVVVRYPGGVQVAFGGSLVNSYGDEHELVAGEAAAILLSRRQRGLLFKEADTVAAGWEQYAKKEMLGDWRGIILDAEATKYKSHDEPQPIGPDADAADFHGELEKFLSCVRSGSAPACDARAGLKAAITAIVAAEAVEKGTVVSFTKEHFEV